MTPEEALEKMRDDAVEKAMRYNRGLGELERRVRELEGENERLQHELEGTQFRASTHHEGWNKEVGSE